MNTRLKWRFSFHMILVAGIVIALLLGSGLAYACVYWDDLVPGGTKYVSGGHNHQINYWYDDFYTYHLVKFDMSSDRTEVTVDSRGCYYGDASDPYNIVYGGCWIYDEDGHHSVFYNDFVFIPVDGNTVWTGTDWYYDEMDSDNPYVIVDQYIWYQTSDSVRLLHLGHTQ
jgi:hypothetical protein